MDKFNTTLTQLGIPNLAFNNVIWQQTVSNMNVTGSAGSGVTNATGIPGNIEMWHQCYSPAAGLVGIPTGNNSNYDFNDSHNASTSCFGSFQVHNYGAAQTIFAYNAWDIAEVDGLGIGNRAINHPDWTYAINAGSYTTKKLYIMVNSGCVYNATTGVYYTSFDGAMAVAGPSDIIHLNCSETLANDLTISLNQTVIIKDGTTLINPVGISITNNGAFNKEPLATFTQNGTFKGNGTYNGDFINNGIFSPGN